MCSGDERLGLYDGFLGSFSVYPFKNSSAHLLVLRIKNKVKAECGIVFDFSFLVFVMDFLIGDTFQPRKVVLAE